MNGNGPGLICSNCDEQLYPISAFAAACIEKHGWVLLPGAPLERDDAVVPLEGVDGWAVLA